MKKQGKVLAMILAVGILMSMMSMVAFAANGLTPEEWNDFFKTTGNNEIGMHMFADAACKNPLNPDYIKVEMNIEKLIGGGVDAWMTLGFVQSAENPMAVAQGTPKGVSFMLRNNEGKMNLLAMKDGVSNVLMEVPKQEDINIIGDLTFEFERDAANNTWHLYVNGKKMDADNNVFAGIKPEDFTDANGKTYVSFAAYDNTGDAMNSRVWTVKNITDEKPKTVEEPKNDTAVKEETAGETAKPAETNPTTADQGVAMFAFLAVAAAVVVTGKKKLAAGK